MNRYNKNRINKEHTNDMIAKKNKNIFENNIFNDDVIVIVTKYGDRLDKLAYKYYGDTSLWYIIADYNNIQTNSLYVKPNTTIKILKKINKWL